MFVASMSLSVKIAAWARIRLDCALNLVVASRCRHAWGLEGNSMKSILAAFVLAMCAYVTGVLYQTDPNATQHDHHGTGEPLKLAKLH
jgi:hypothetical protein